MDTLPWPETVPTDFSTPRIVCAYPCLYLSRSALSLYLDLHLAFRYVIYDGYTKDFTCANVCVLQGTDLIKVSRFYKDSKEGKFVSFLYEDTRTLYDGFRKGAKESSKSEL